MPDPGFLCGDLSGPAPVVTFPPTFTRTFGGETCTVICAQASPFRIRTHGAPSAPSLFTDTWFQSTVNLNPPAGAAPPHSSSRNSGLGSRCFVCSHTMGVLQEPPS